MGIFIILYRFSHDSPVIFFPVFLSVFTPDGEQAIHQADHKTAKDTTGIIGEIPKCF